MKSPQARAAETRRKNKADHERAIEEALLAANKPKDGEPKGSVEGIAAATLIQGESLRVHPHIVLNFYGGAGPDGIVGAALVSLLMGEDEEDDSERSSPDRETARDGEGERPAGVHAAVGKTRGTLTRVEEVGAAVLAVLSVARRLRDHYHRSPNSEGEEKHFASLNETVSEGNIDQKLDAMLSAAREANAVIGDLHSEIFG